MIHLKFIVILLGIFLKCDSHRQGGGWVSRPRGNGNGQVYRNPYHNGYSQRGNNYNNNNNHWGHQEQVDQDSINGQGSQLEPAPAVSCQRPVFTDDAKLVIEKCERERFHTACWNSSSNVPTDWKVVMDCRKGSSIMQYPSTCSSSGEWSPQLFDSCNSLFQHAQLRPLMNGGKCTMLKMQVSENFNFECFLPDAVLEAKDCQALSTVPSGTISMLKCKPPFQSQDGHNSEWVCQDGSWKGDFNKRLKCFYSNPLPNSYGHVSTTVKPFVEMTALPLPVTKRTTTSRPIPSTQRLTTILTTKAPVLPVTSSSPITTRVTTTMITTRKPKPPLVTSLPPQIAVTCPALRSRPGIKLECISKSPSGSDIFLNSCNVPQAVGSEASYSCKQYYESTAGLTTLYRRCKENGIFTGNAENFNCVFQCGKNNAIFVPFITSGTPTFRGQWPWHAAMFLKENFDSQKWTYICGGTLISRRAILTASHCVTFTQSAKVRDPSNFRLDLGRFMREEVDDTVQSKEVSSIHVHPSYSPFGYDSDIAIVILKDDITIGYHVRPICFPQTLNSALEELQLSESSVGTVAGWGYNENSELANELHMAELKVGSQKDCSDSARGFETGSIQAKSTTFCARSKNGTKDVNVCNGDSGGGMYFPLKNSDFTRWYIQGIVSVGVADENGKCKPSQYSIFTRVGRYADWIVRVISENDAL